MTTIFEDALEAHESEITLNTSSLLGMFLGLAMICAVFFGYGYAVGRTVIMGDSAAGAGTDAEYSNPDGAAPSAGQSLPSEPAASAVEARTEWRAATATLQVQETPPSPAAATAAPDSIAVTAQAAPAQAAPALVSASPFHPFHPVQPAQPVQPARAASPPAPGLANSRAAGAIMVQIAAANSPGNAAPLIAALRKLGYPAVLRTSPRDKFYHVQVGPYDRAGALATRKKLLASGYSPILKP